MSGDSHWLKVKVPGDMVRLMRWCWLSIEPPYWYLRCKACDRRYSLPWDVRQRTAEAIEILTQHDGRDCAEPHVAQLEERERREPTPW
jgi:hypothetical protein